jgi:NarL family two-component system sensor histidine kinase YdfH
MMHTIRTFFQSDEMAEARPFYIILTSLILITSALTLFQPPNPLPFGRLPLYGLLLALHLGLHWLSAFIAKHSRWGTAYLLGQGGLALILVMVSQRPELVLTLYAALIAETLGVFGLTRLAAASVVGYSLLTFVSLFALGGPPLLAEWASPAISTITLFIIFMVLYRRQSEARERSQTLLADLETAHHQLADYAAQVENLTLATERQRMARELHDTLAQGVAGLVLQLEAANNHLENGRFPRAQTIVQQSMKRARSTLADARAAIDDLRLEDRTLSEVVHHHINRFTQATGIPCHLALNLGAETAVPSLLAEHAERIISESLNNVTRHAQASNVWLTIAQSTEQLTIVVRDDGVGFNVETAVRTGHYGLLGMRERTRLVNGTFEMTSQAQRGTSLHISLPLEVA